MNDKGKIVRVIESDTHEIKTLMLWFQFSNENDMKALFVPKLRISDL